VGVAFELVGLRYAARHATLCAVLGRALKVFSLAAALVVVAVPVASGSAPVAHAAGYCGIPHHGQHLGPTYLTSLSVSSTSCSTGLSVVREYHACQLKHGGVKGKCSSAVDGFRCTEKRGPSIPTEFFSSVACQNRSARVNYKYSQFT
jgi:hypothetical protein